MLVRLVQTDMGSRAAQLNGLEKAPVTVEDTVPGITRQVRRNTDIMTIWGSLTPFAD